MKLESLKSSKFEALSESAMKHIVGGQKCQTPAGTHTTSENCEVKHSNDYTDNDGTTAYASGGDFSKTTMDRIPTCSFEVNVTPNLTDPTVGGITNGITL